VLVGSSRLWVAKRSGIEKGDVNVQARGLTPGTREAFGVKGSLRRSPYDRKTERVILRNRTGSRLVMR